MMVEATHHEHGHDHDHHDDHGHDSDHDDHATQGGHDDWGNEEFVAGWLERQQDRAEERRRQFTLIRAVIPKRPDDEFRYLNLGAGPGNLDEVLLTHFKGATATLVDYSLPMLDAARERLKAYGDRVEIVQANLTAPEWVGGVGGSFDFVVSTLAVHHVETPHRIRELYTEVYRLLGHGGAFFNLDYVRAGRPSFEPLAAWAAQDPDAGLNTRRHNDELPGTLLEHLGWLAEASFTCVDVLWKDLSSALLCGVRDHIHIPSDEHGHSHAH
jgi:tRNA (cmo5U34)-methyltransferase